MVELQEYGFVRRTDEEATNQRTGFVYEVVSYEEYHRLQSSINTALDDVLSRLKAAETKRRK
jgi:predicted transcriptional regulator